MFNPLKKILAVMVSSSLLLSCSPVYALAKSPSTQQLHSLATSQSNVAEKMLKDMGKEDGGSAEAHRIASDSDGGSAEAHRAASNSDGGDNSKVELLRKRYDNGKLNVVIIGGTGGIGASIANRLREKGDINVIIGSSSREMPEKEIFASQDAIAIGDISILAVPADAIDSTTRKIASFSKPGATWLSLAVPMSIGEDGKKMHSPKEEFESAAQHVETILNTEFPDKAIKVVSTMHNVSEEQYRDLQLVLDQIIVVLGEEKACSFVCEQIIKRISNLVPVVKGGLSDSKFSEMLTPYIIDSGKELLQGRTLSELYDFVKARNGKVSYDELMVFNREILDPQLKEEYSDAKNLDKAMKSLFDDSISEGNKEKVLVRLKRFSDITSPELAEIIKPTLNLYSVYLANSVVLGRLRNAEFDSLVEAVGEAEGAKGAVLISDNTVFQNAAVLSTLLEFKNKQPNIKIGVLIDKENVLAANYKVIDIKNVADMVSYNGRIEALKELEAKFGIKPNQVVMVNTADDIEKIKSEFKVAELEDVLLNPDFKGLKFIEISKPTRSGKETLMNNMLLVFSKAYASILNKEEKVARKYSDFVSASAQTHKLSEEDVKIFNDLAMDISKIGMVKFGNRDEAAKKQNSYAAAVIRL